jgi:hypothetical protein
LVLAGAASGAFRWSASLQLDPYTRGAMNAVACVSASRCVAVDSAGGEVAFNPGAHRALVAAGQIAGHTTMLNAVDCASTAQCTAVDEQGEEVTFDPARPGRARRELISPASPLHGVSCPSPAQCTAVNGRGEEITFDPARPRSATVREVSPGNLLTRVTCPTATQCTTVTTGMAFTFDPTLTGAAKTTVGLGSSAPPRGLACPTAARCLEIDSAGGVTVFDPSTGVAMSPASVPGAGTIRWMTCPASTVCVAANTAGSVVTFDPAAPGTATSISIDPMGAPYGGLFGVSCPSAAQCTAVGYTGREFTFAPSGTATASAQLIDVNGPAPSLSSSFAVACASTRQCSLLDSTGYVATFDPARPRGLAARRLSGPISDYAALSCPSASLCVAAGQDSTCCGGSVTTFDPRGPSVSYGNWANEGGIDAIACVSATECTEASPGAYTIANGHGLETFDPGRPGGPPLARSQADGGFSALACPSTHQCTAAGTYAVPEVTFDPAAPAHGKSHRLPDIYLVSLACPSAKLCLAGNEFGQVQVFAPRSGRALGSTRIGASSQFVSSLACSSPVECLAVDGNNRAYVVDPRHPKAWAFETIAKPLKYGQVAATAVACPSARECVVVAADGQLFVGRT